MVTGVEEEIRYRPHMVTGIHEHTPNCSLGTSSRRQTKARSTTQPPFCSESISAIIEADQVLLALQQLASNSNSPIINKNHDKISKLSKFLTTTMPTFEEKSEKFELFQDVSQMSLKIRNPLTEEDKIN